MSLHNFSLTLPSNVTSTVHAGGLLSRNTPEQSFERIIGLVQTVLNVPISAVSLVDADRPWFKSSVGLAADEIRRDISFFTHTVKERDSLNIPDARLDSRFRDDPMVSGSPFIRSYLGIPLSTSVGYNVGSLCAFDIIPRNYSPVQIDIVKTFATLLVSGLELRRIAQTDHLTGAATRRCFTLELEKTLSRFRRSGHPTALVILDIDHFKTVNDTYGHPAGDLVLQTVASELTGQLRQSDTLARLGGEEFGILLQDIEPGSVLDTTERLRRHLESISAPHSTPIKVTASFGITVLDKEVDSVQTWLASADSAMYEAKKAGRNRCCVFKRAVH